MSLSETLPEQINVRRFANKQAHLKGELDLGSADRLGDLVDEIRSAADVELEFGFESTHKPLLNCRIRATVAMQCQRCMASMDVVLKTDSDLVVVESEEDVEDLPKEIEPLVLADDMLEMLSLVEDELILALPLVPSHDDESCGGGKANDKGFEKPNPFAVLEQLKKK